MFVGALRRSKELFSQAVRLRMLLALRQCLYFLLQDIGIKVDLLIMVKTDNIGALFSVANSSTGVRRRHVDTQYRFICENVEGGIVKVKSVKSNDNNSDTSTKDVNHNIYEKHAKKCLGNVDEFKRTLQDRKVIGNILYAHSNLSLCA
jgi:hypothetical protein